VVPRAMCAPPCANLQVLYGILIQHFAMLAGESPLPLAHLDAMVPLLLPMTAEVPFYAATVARARYVCVNAHMYVCMSVCTSVWDH